MEEVDDWSLSVDYELANKLKQEYPEHFENLVRMHLSFALELGTDDDYESNEKSKARTPKWVFPFPKKGKTAKESTVQSNSLTTERINRIRQIVQFLSNEENISQEGIFRRTGSLSRQLQLKKFLNDEVEIDLEDNRFSVHDCASVLKNYLADLPEPLVTDSFYPLYCKICDLCKGDEESLNRLLGILQLLTLLLPSENVSVLRYIIQLLQKTIQYVNQNKMSAENLATLFTPHLLCPRKLSGESLHANAQMLTPVVIFMINSGAKLFKIPDVLAVDIKLCWHEKQRIKLQQRNNVLNESVADGVVNTLLSFVDRERTAQENTTNPTEAALAQLYAHIQSLPESSKKRKLVKQFNKENGCGTPKRALLANDKCRTKPRNLGGSLKKHIFSKGNRSTNRLDKSCKEIENRHVASTMCSEPRTKSNAMKIFEKSLDCIDCACSNSSNEGPIEKYKNLTNDDCSINDDVGDEDETDEGKIDNNNEGGNNNNVTNEHVFFTPPTSRRSISKLVSRKSSTKQCYRFNCPLTSTPAVLGISNVPLTPSPVYPSNDDNMSPITMSAKKMPIAMQEMMMTPRSRRPVIAISGSNAPNCEKMIVHENPKEGENLTSSEDLTDPFKDYLFGRSVLTASPTDLSFSSRTGDFDPSSDGKMSESLLYVLDGNVPSSDEADNNSTGFVKTTNNSFIHETIL